MLSFLDVEGFLMSWLHDVFQTFPHPSLVDEEAAVLLPSRLVCYISFTP